MVTVLPGFVTYSVQVVVTGGVVGQLPGLVTVVVTPGPGFVTVVVEPGPGLVTVTVSAGPLGRRPRRRMGTAPATARCVAAHPDLACR